MWDFEIDVELDRTEEPVTVLGMELRKPYGIMPLPEEPRCGEGTIVLLLEDAA